MDSVKDVLKDLDRSIWLRALHYLQMKLDRGIHLATLLKIHGMI